MADLYRVQIRAIDGKLLTCRVTELYGGDGFDLASSRTLALGFLWDTVDGTVDFYSGVDVSASSPLGQELDGRDFGDDWDRANVGRFISCVGVVDRSKEEEKYDDGTTWEFSQATYHIAVTDPRWLGRLTPGMDWRSRVWDHDAPVKFEPAWRTSEVRAIARGIHATSDYSAMPILADALQEAGCDSDDLLSHLRDTAATHVRGCWALELVLGYA